MASDELTIKVRRHAEEEHVIYAGAPAASDGAQDASDEAGRAASAGKAPASTPALKPPTTEDRPASTDAFRETTLDDIESSTMSGLQKGIIVGAVLLIVACIAWYVLFMS